MALNGECVSQFCCSWSLSLSSVISQNLTEFNTAHNRRIAVMSGNIVDAVVNPSGKRKRKNSHVRFQEEEEIINPGIDEMILLCS